MQNDEEVARRFQGYGTGPRSWPSPAASRLKPCPEGGFWFSYDLEGKGSIFRLGDGAGLELTPSMPLAENCFPISTDFDPTEDSLGSVDPLGTLGDAERLADVLLPGFTARMYRPRLLTVTALTAAIADRVVRAMNSREEVRLPARLAFERLFVSALVWCERDENSRSITSRVPGRRRARQAYDLREPLTQANFLKGQAVNGPFGVMARLATALGILDDRGLPGRTSADLLIAWSRDEGLDGVLDDDGESDRAGAQWAGDVTRAVSRLVGQNEWPNRGQKIWGQLGSPTRPDKLKVGERRKLTASIESNPIGRRVFELLSTRRSVDAYRAVKSREASRGEIEREVLIRGVSPQLGRSPVDRLIGVTARTVDSYEAVCSAFEQAFDTLRWRLTLIGGAAKADAILGDRATAKAIDSTISSLHQRKSRLDKALSEVNQEPALTAAGLVDSLEKLRSDAFAVVSREDLIATVLARHERVQKTKRKAVWIERGASWTLMPGFGVAEDVPPSYGRAYLHPFRIQNAYSFLTDLGKVSVAISPEDGG
jgi:hypothetical protein